MNDPHCIVVGMIVQTVHSTDLILACTIAYMAATKYVLCKLAAALLCNISELVYLYWDSWVVLFAAKSALGKRTLDRQTDSSVLVCIVERRHLARYIIIQKGGRKS